MKHLAGLLLVTTLTFTAAPVAAAPLACTPCGGFSVEDPFALLSAMAAAPPLADDALAVVAYELPLDGAATPAAAHALAARRLAPWIRLVFRTPSPLLEQLDELQAELDAAAAVARSRPAGARYQVLWRPADATETALSAEEYAFLVKRASVALTGADPDADVASQPLPAEPAWIEELYGHEVAAYFDALALAPGADLGPAVARLRSLDPGKPLVLDGAALPAAARGLLAAAAEGKEAGFDLVLFAAGESAVTPEHAAALVLLANEFRGELSLDAGTRPTGGSRAWSFVRGEDLALRVIAEPAAGSDELRLSFPDPQLRSPVALLGAAAELVPLGGFRRTANGVEVLLADPEPAVVLRLERASIAELEGVEEEVTVADSRAVPVEEILRRLQAFEDAQSRRVRHWQAVNSTTLRFQAASGVGSVEATFQGEAFFRPGQPFDWAWQSFYINGVKWTGKKIPEIPLVQPEKATALPLEILFTKEYRYALRGTETVRGRDCWRIEFEPAVAAEPGRTLFRGAVWVDRETSARVRTRAVQLGLTGEVISNEETIDYLPVDSAGAEAAWTPAAFVLPLQTTGQQLLSVLNTATVVERQVTLTAVTVNGDGFDRRREEVLASAATMVRDTDAGLRYLVPADGGAPGERVVKEGFDSSKLFLLGGVFYDDSLDYPLPLAGVNYFDLNFRGGERQLNAFFGGVLGIVSYADPHLFGSKVDLGVDVFAIGIATTDELYRDGRRAAGEDVEERPARVTFNLGLPLGSFLKFNSSYRLAYAKYGRADDTAGDFVLPSDHLSQQISLDLQFARGGYRVDLQAAYADRSKWERWGLPGDAFDPDTATYTTWEISAAKNWYFPGFRKFGLELAYLDGDRLDRFSKYQFGFFGSSRVHGYQIGKVRAEKAYMAHATYGFEVGQLLRLDGVVDAAWATDRESGLDRELLSGVGLAGTFQGPWETLVQIDIGTPIAGPDDGVVAYVVFLKLFD